MPKLLLVLTTIFTFAYFPSQSAQAACSSSISSGSVRVGSTITGGSLEICASTSTAKKTASTKTSTGTATTKKLPTSIKVVVTPPPPCVIKVPAAAMVYGMSITGCSIVAAPPTKVVVTPAKPTSKTTITNTVTEQSDQAAFTPNQIGIASSSGSGTVGQSFWFSALAGAHSRSGTILGQAANVQFTPIRYNWRSDDGDGGSGASFSASWASVGAHSVALTVAYSVSYTLGAGWIDAGEISSSASATVTVGAALVVEKIKVTPPLLVSANCLAKPQAYRC